MAKLGDVIEGLRAKAGAEFAFVLTRGGVLVTEDAPRDMPESGRARMVRAAESVASKRTIAMVRLPRRELVPYGGPAPVHVAVAMAAERAIVCLVVTTEKDLPPATRALGTGLPVIESLIQNAVRLKKTSDATKAKGKASAPDSGGVKRRAAEKKPAGGARKKTDDGPEIIVGPTVPLGRESLAAIELEQLAAEAPVAQRGAPDRTDDNAPAITVGPAVPLGRESLAAIELEQKAPEIILGPAVPLGQESLAAIELDQLLGKKQHRDAESSPRITVERARQLGRESLAAIELDIALSGPAAEAPIPPEVLRQTLPWIELEPESSKKKA